MIEFDWVCFSVAREPEGASCQYEITASVIWPLTYNTNSHNIDLGWKPSSATKISTGWKPTPSSMGAIRKKS